MTAKTLIASLIVWQDLELLSQHVCAPAAGLSTAHGNFMRELESFTGTKPKANSLSWAKVVEEAKKVLEDT